MLIQNIKRLLPLLCLCLSMLGRGQSIRGLVLDQQNGEPLIGANIRWAENTVEGTITDIDGAFTLTVPSQDDSLLVTYLGYKDWQRVVSPQDTNLIIRLTPDSKTIAGVMVVAERRPARIFATEQLNRLDIYLTPAAKADVLLAVNSLPAATNPDETANVSLRGSPYQATGIFLNNIPLYDAVRLDQPNGIGQFSIFNTSTVTGLDIYPSNPPLYLGQASSGAVSIRTADQIQRQSRALNLHLAGGGLQWEQELGKKSGLLAYFNYGNHRLLKGGNPRALRDIDFFRSIDAATYFTHAFTDRIQLRVFQLWISERYGYFLTSGRFRGPFNQQKERQLSIVNLSHQGRRWRFEWNQGLNWSKARYAFGNILTNLRQTDYHGNFLAHWCQGPWTGTSALHYTLRRQSAQGTYPLYTGAWEADDPSAGYQQQARIRTPELATFAKRTVGKRTMVGVGTRLGYDPLRHQTLWAAQLLWHYSLGKHHRLRWATGRYYQQDWPQGEAPDLHYNRSYQLALDWKWAQQRWKLQAGVYHHWSNWQGQKNPIYGAEGTVRYESYPLRLWISASHVSSRLLRGRSSYPSAFDFAYLLRAGCHSQLPAQFSLTASWLLRQGSYYIPLAERQWEDAIDDYVPVFQTADQGARLPYYQRLDLGLSKTFLIEDSFLIAYLNVNNVLGRDNLREYAYNNDYSQATPTYFSRRTWFTGVVYQWQ